jgi:hypothetical protein
MQAKKVYESISDILKPKGEEDIRQSMNLSDHNKPFQETIIALFKLGYIPNILPEASRDARENSYSYQGKKIIWGDAAWITLKSSEDLDKLDLSCYSYDDSPPHTDSMLHMYGLENGTTVVEISINFRGTWKNQDEDFDGFNGTKILTSEDQITPTVLMLVKKAELFLKREINKLDAYCEYGGFI